MNDQPRPAFVLVHSPLVGPLLWQPVAEVLRRRGHDVVVPRLDNDTDGTLYLHHAERVRRSVEAETDAETVVLVGHSAAAALLPVIGHDLVARVAAYVFVDGDVLPDRARHVDGLPPDLVRRLRTMVHEGMLPPWSQWWSEEALAAALPDPGLHAAFSAELAPVPVRLLEEPIPRPAAWPDAPCAFVRLSEVHNDTAARAKKRGWAVASVDVGHLGPLVHPEPVASTLTGLVETLEGRAAPTPVGARSAPDDDRVLATRRRVSRLVDAGRRAGYSALALAIVLFAVALYWNLPPPLVWAVVACLAVATVTLLPSIVLGYGVSAAEREDREGPPGRTPS